MNKASNLPVDYLPNKLNAQMGSEAAISAAFGILPPATTGLRIRHSPRSRELSEVSLMEPQVFRLHENTILNAQKLLRFLGYHDGI